MYAIDVCKSICSCIHLSPIEDIPTDKPIAGEVVVAVVGFKGIIGFGLSFGTNLWVDAQGYQNGERHLTSTLIFRNLIAAVTIAFGQMAAIAGLFLLGGLVVRVIPS